MGADIHYTFQKKENDTWVDIEGLDDGYDDDWNRREFELGRHYLLFSVIADVRNRWDIKPIAEPRGLPEDIVTDGYFYGDHSFSWLTSTEILSWFNQHPTYEIFNSGIVSCDEYREWDGVSPFDCYCQMIGGRDIKLLDDYSKVWMLHFNLKAYNEYTHVRVKWKEDIIPDLEYFKEMIKKLHNEYGEIRFVFGFDS